MRRGKITSLNASQGSGFIEDENEQEIEFSLKELNQPVNINDRITFEIEIDKYGLKATQIVVLTIGPSLLSPQEG